LKTRQINGDLLEVFNICLIDPIFLNQLGHEHGFMGQWGHGVGVSMG